MSTTAFVVRACVIVITFKFVIATGVWIYDKVKVSFLFYKLLCNLCIPILIEEEEVNYGGLKHGSAGYL